MLWLLICIYFANYRSSIDFLATDGPAPPLIQTKLWERTWNPPQMCHLGGVGVQSQPHPDFCAEWWVEFSPCGRNSGLARVGRSVPTLRTGISVPQWLVPAQLDSSQTPWPLLVQQNGKSRKALQPRVNGGGLVFLFFLESFLATVSSIFEWLFFCCRVCKTCYVAQCQRPGFDPDLECYLCRVSTFTLWPSFLQMPRFPPASQRCASLYVNWQL